MDRLNDVARKIRLAFVNPSVQVIELNSRRPAKLARDLKQELDGYPITKTSTGVEVRRKPK